MALCANEPCDRFGFPILENLCMEHYREIVIKPAWNLMCDAEMEYTNLRHNLYRVEVASGMRAAPSYDAPSRVRAERPRVARAKEAQTVVDEENLDADI